MAERWVPTARKRLILSSLDVLAKLVPGVFAPTRRTESEQAAPRDILVVELWNIGDVVLTLSFLAELRAKWPKARVTILARPYARDILEGTGLIDDYIETDLGWDETTTRLNPLGYRWSELWRVTRELRRRKFDIAFKARMHVREHVLLAASGARRRVGYAFGTGDSALTDAVVRSDPDQHKVADWLGLLAPFGGPVHASVPRLQPGDAEREWAGGFLHDCGISDTDVLIGIHPGASVPAKRWPVACFAEVARALAGRQGIRLVGFVDPQGLGGELGAEPGVVLAQTDLRRLIALIERCRLLVCNDSGPMHLAGAMGIPVVALFGARVSRWFAPLGANHELLVADAGRDHADVKGISAARVIDAVNRLLERA